MSKKKISFNKADLKKHKEQLYSNAHADQEEHAAESLT